MENNHKKKLRFRIVLDEQTNFKQLNKIVEKIESVGFEAEISENTSNIGFYKK